jgi:predicted secreted protein
MEGELMELQAVAHCLLNPHTRVKGLEGPKFKAEGPQIQLPCPEALYLGLDRWAVTRNQLDVPEFRRFCRSLVTHHVDLIGMMASSLPAPATREEEFEGRLTSTFRAGDYSWRSSP